MTPQRCDAAGLVGEQQVRRVPAARRDGLRAVGLETVLRNGPYAQLVCRVEVGCGWKVCGGRVECRSWSLVTVPECGLLLRGELQGHLARRTLLRREKLPSAMRWVMWERWARREGQYSQWGKEEPCPSECRPECPGSGVVRWIE